LYSGAGNDPPYFDGLEDEYHGQEERLLKIENYAKDPDEDWLTYGAEDMPQGMTIESSTGLITWIPDYTKAGDHDIIITVSDGEYTFHRLVTITIRNVKKIKH
jgi:hypothetical protein